MFGGLCRLAQRCVGVDPKNGLNRSERLARILLHGRDGGRTRCVASGALPGICSSWLDGGLAVSFRTSAVLLLLAVGCQPSATSPSDTDPVALCPSELGSLEWTGMDFGPVCSALWMDVSTPAGSRHHFVATNQAGYCDSYRALLQGLADLNAVPFDGTDQQECEHLRDYVALQGQYRNIEGASYLDIDLYVSDLEPQDTPLGGTYPNPDEGMNLVALVTQVHSNASSEVANVDCTDPDWGNAFSTEALYGEISTFDTVVAPTVVTADAAGYDFSFGHVGITLGGPEIASMSGDLRFERCEIVIETPSPGL